MKYRCLIIGLGQIGMGYDYSLNSDRFILSHARSFSKHPDFELVGGVDTDIKKCLNFETEYKRKSYQSLEKAITELNPSILVIATSSNSHGSILKEILKLCTPVAVVSEKPLDESLDAAKYMVEECEKKGVKLFVNYIRRSQESSVEIKRMIDNNIIQSPIKAYVWYTKGLLNNGSHMLNLLEYWFGNIEEHHLISSNRYWNGCDPELDFIVSFKNASAIFCSGWEEYFPHLSIELLSPSGRLFYSQGGRDISWQASDANEENPKKKVLDAGVKMKTNLNYYQLDFVENLALALKGKKHNISTGVDALNTLNNINNIVNEETL